MSNGKLRKLHLLRQSSVSIPKINRWRYKRKLPLELEETDVCQVLALCTIHKKLKSQRVEKKGNFRNSMFSEIDLKEMFGTSFLLGLKVIPKF